MLKLEEQFLTLKPVAARHGRIPSLDGLRALSIFLVVCLHTLQRYSIHHHVAQGWFILFNGGDGVFIFFEISGFLITTLLLREHQRYGSVSLRGFFLRRAFRILPPLYFYVAVVVALGLLGRLALNAQDILSSLFFFHNFPYRSGSLSDPMWSFEHLWSISVEEQFYIVWPFLLVACLRLFRKTPQTDAAKLPLLFLAVMPFLRVFLAMRESPFLHSIGIRLNFDFLMFGCVIALLQHTPRFESVYRMATKVWWLPIAIMGVCSMASVRYQNYFNLPIGFTINGAAIAMFLLWCIRNPESTLGRALNWRPIVTIGMLSYSIYLWQTMFLYSLNAQVFGKAAWLGTFPFNWAGFFVAGAFSYFFIEQPSLRLRDVVIKRLRDAKARRQSLPQRFSGQPVESPESKG